MGKIDANGEYQTIAQVGLEQRIEKKITELEKPPAPEEDPKPPTTTDPGPDPGSVTVDEFFVADVGAEFLPKENDATEYRARAADGAFGRLAQMVVEQSGVDLDAFTGAVETARTAIRAAELALDTKDVVPAPGSTPGEFEPLPGVTADPACTSLFDANDLALRGKKSVSKRQYNQPLAMIDAYLGSGPTASRWMFGEKLEYQQEWRHEGFTLGEISSSLSLLPGEELSIEVSSYQRTKQEIQQEKDDTTRRQLSLEQRNTDERNCTNQTAADNGWSISASASVSYPVASASVTAGAFGNSSERAEQSRRQLTEATTRSTSEVSSRRAVKITQTSEFGSESTTTRRLRNPSTCQTVTYNFFQVIKIYDLQLRIVGDRPMILIPGIFPRFYGAPEVRKGQVPEIRPTDVEIPVHVFDGLRAPAAFLSRYFEVDREVSKQISGWALRLRGDMIADPASAARLWAEALVVAARYLFLVDPEAEMARLATLFRNYCAAIRTNVERTASTYGVGKGSSLQINTPGVYVDSLRGRCTACSDHDEAGRYVEVMTGLEELRRLKKANELDDQEVLRRQKRLDDDLLDPFEPAATP